MIRCCWRTMCYTTARDMIYRSITVCARTPRRRNEWKRKRVKRFRMRFVRYRVYLHIYNNDNKLYIIIICVTPDCRSEYPDWDGADADDFHR